MWKLQQAEQVMYPYLGVQSKIGRVLVLALVSGWIDAFFIHVWNDGFRPAWLGRMRQDPTEYSSKVFIS